MSSAPVPNLPEKPLWARFSADPRAHGAFRASDADRDVAADVVNTAFQEGRLDTIEHGDRLAAVLQAKTLGELVPLMADVQVSAAPRPPTPRQQQVRKVSISSWLALAVMFNVIWLLSWALSGDAPYYYWPAWPMLGTGIPVMIAWLASRNGDDPGEGPRRLGS